VTDTERGLLDSILENPKDNTPRLIYADYLDENGEPEHAAFIRAQINHKYGWVKPRAHQIRKWFRWPFKERIYDTNKGRIGKSANLVFSNQRTEVSQQFAIFTVERGFVDEIHAYPNFFYDWGWKVFRKLPVAEIGLIGHREYSHVEIDAPGEDYGWQAYYFVPDQVEYHTVNGWETRDEMILGVIADIREANG